MEQQQVWAMRGSRRRNKYFCNESDDDLEQAADYSFRLCIDFCKIWISGVVIPVYIHSRL